MSRRSRSFKSPQITSGFKQLARVRNTREELERLIIACEGKVSEKNYFQDFFNDLKQNRRIANTSFVIVRHQHTDPLGVLEDLLSHLEQDSNFEHKWIVIDRDKERTNGGGHSERSFNEAIRKAKRKNINVAYSNPCFEIWYLLHLEFRNTAIDRDDIIKELEKKLNGYQKNQSGMYAKLKDRQQQAIVNAKRLFFEYTTRQVNLHKPAKDNPCTTIYQLVEILNRFRDV